MQLTSRQRSAGEIEYGIIFGCIALVMLVAARTIPIQEFFPACVFRSATACPCPTCGSTRAFQELAHGHFVEAFLMNPLVVILIGSSEIALAANTAVLLFGIRRPLLILTSRESLFLRLAVLAAFLGNWAYLIVMNR